mmetsp:Transcript_4523/g.13020  ORF Transcript_4523/g.13020 Transcript_4523/m.13020 type:complete len:117 (+) Transcript_4523:111-461(+)
MHKHVLLLRILYYSDSASSSFKSTVGRLYSTRLDFTTSANAHAHIHTHINTPFIIIDSNRSGLDMDQIKSNHQALVVVVVAVALVDRSSLCKPPAKKSFPRPPLTYLSICLQYFSI